MVLVGTEHKISLGLLIQACGQCYSIWSGCGYYHIQEREQQTDRYCSEKPK